MEDYMKTQCLWNCLEENIDPIKTYFISKQNYSKEIDFVLKKGNKVTVLIQVCYDLSNETTMEREYKALVEASQELKCNNLVVLSGSEENEIEYKNRKIKITPLLNFFLGIDKT
jgi:uncharacterized protein